MNETVTRQWYLLTSKPRKDELAEEHLRRQGFEVYRPVAQRLRKYRGKLLSRTESLFPSYMFVHLDKLSDNWAPIRSTQGVQHFVRFGSANEPLPVPETIILDLKAHEDYWGEKAIDLDRFHSGDAVIPTDGPFKGLQGVFMSYDGEERAIILLEILHKQAKLVISPAKLMAA